ncbi:amino acid permease, partial [Streptococcus suis]
NITAKVLLPNGLVVLISVLLSVKYAFSCVEMIGISAGETDNTKKAVPQAIKSTIGLLVIFFVLTIVVLAALLPMSEAG